jgi:hypothetical protein
MADFGDDISFSGDDENEDDDFLSDVDLAPLHDRGLSLPSPYVDNGPYIPISPVVPRVPPRSPPGVPPRAPDVTIVGQPPERWYQRKEKGTEQSFSIESSIPFDDYTLDLLFVSSCGETTYDPVGNTRKIDNGFSHHRTKDTRNSDLHLTVRPTIHICTRKGDCLFVLQLTLSSGYVVRSRPFSVHSKRPVQNTFRPDAIRILRQLEWCPTTQRCHICNNASNIGHLPICALNELLPG